ncbi:MAG: hypothetical protein WGN25_16420 [Candidatus Electrothrix sp. GW3-4]|uniref:hypothetical protein n=1 Tax=Candidatus Electrothrix sp. GW3-4 TaxID=3126740 RepID=UPI0030CD90D0
MMVVAKILVFLLGMSVAVQVVAAFYGIIDLWYAIRTEYPRVLKGILFWCGISALIAFLVGEDLRMAFLRGMVFYLPFYVANFYILQSIIRYRYKKGEEVIDKEQQQEPY